MKLVNKKFPTFSDFCKYREINNLLLHYIPNINKDAERLYALHTYRIPYSSRRVVYSDKRSFASLCRFAIPFAYYEVADARRFGSASVR